MPFVGAPPVIVKCVVCGTPKKMYVSHLRRVKRPTCSRRCNGKERSKELVKYSGNMKGRERKDKRYGPANPAWKGGVTIKRPKGNYRGVRYVRAPQWAKPMARADGYIMEHRLVMAGWCGRLLTRREVVNHENHNPSKNERSNLTLWPSNADHKRWEGGHFVEGVANRWSPRDLELR